MTSNYNGVGAVVRAARDDIGLTAAELARRAQLSPAQVSRIEAGITAKPSRSTLTALARALDRHPRLLFVVAGHEDQASTRTALKRMLRDSSELSEDWSFLGRDISAARALVESERSSLVELQGLAAEIFRSREVYEITWHDSYAALAAERRDPVLESIIDEYRDCTPQRRELIELFAGELGELSRREELDEIREGFPEYGRT